jgi:hypothetical protein
VIGKQYFVRQAAILFGLAKATTDPKISAALLDKALILNRRWTNQARRLTRRLSHRMSSRPERDLRPPQLAAFLVSTSQAWVVGSFEK